jgi:hypothetical protein
LKLVKLRRIGEFFGLRGKLGNGHHLASSRHDPLAAMSGHRSSNFVPITSSSCSSSWQACNVNPSICASRACISTSLLPRQSPSQWRLAHDNDGELQISPRNPASSYEVMGAPGPSKLVRAAGRACSTRKAMIVRGFL